MKTPAHPHKTANGSEVAPSEGVPREKNTYAPDGGPEKWQFSSSSAYSGLSNSNGEDTEAPQNAPSAERKPRSEVEEKIIRTWREHPGWSMRRIGRECLVTDKRAQRTINAAKANGAL